MALSKLREKIDSIDFQLLKLLDKRMELALRLRRFKDHTEDKKREAEVLKNYEEFPNTLFDENFSRNILKSILNESKRVQDKQQKLIGFQGEHGAYSEVAARYFHSGQVYIPFREFKEVMEAVEQGHVDLGIVPVENSLGGAVTPVNDLLMETDLKIVGEVKLKISHSLLARPGVKYEEIKNVFSHPQALSQCRRYIDREGFESKPFFDTAGSAKMLSESDFSSSAAIASKLCAHLYKLSVLKEGVADDISNVTRFVILSKDALTEGGNKSSIIVQTPHKPGSLFQILEMFARESINLTRIESFSMIGDGLNYAFFIDFLAEPNHPNVVNVLEKVKNEAGKYKFLGNYHESDPVAE